MFFSSVPKIPVEDLPPHRTDVSTTSPTTSNNRTVQPNLLQRYFDDIQHRSTTQTIHSNPPPIKENQRKRCFNVDSLLAPEEPCLIKRQKCNISRHKDVHSTYLKPDSSNVTETYA